MNKKVNRSNITVAIGLSYETNYRKIQMNKLLITHKGKNRIIQGKFRKISVFVVIQFHVYLKMPVLEQLVNLKLPIRRSLLMLLFAHLFT